MRILLCLSFLLFLCLPLSIKAQERAKIQFQEYSTGVGSFYETIPIVPLPMDGEIYTDHEFALSSIQLQHNTEIVDVPLRYNVLNQRVEVLRDDKVFEVDDRRVASFLWKGDGYNKFINIQGLPLYQGSGMDGFVEVLHDSPRIQLHRRYEVEILKANYNVALNTGNKNDTAKLKQKYYIFYNGQLHEFSGKRQELAPIFGVEADQVQKFIKKEKLRFRQEEDYRKLVEFVDGW